MLYVLHGTIGCMCASFTLGWCLDTGSLVRKHEGFPPSFPEFLNRRIPTEWALKFVWLLFVTCPSLSRTLTFPNNLHLFQSHVSVLNSVQTKALFPFLPVLYTEYSSSWVASFVTLALYQLSVFNAFILCVTEVSLVSLIPMVLIYTLSLNSWSSFILSPCHSQDIFRHPFLRFPLLFL